MKKTAETPESQVSDVEIQDAQIEIAKLTKLVNASDLSELLDAVENDGVQLAKIRARINSDAQH